MSNDDFKNRVAGIARAANQKQNSLDAAQTLFEGLTAEAKRQAAAERAEARRRGPLVKILFALALTSCLFAAATGIYGVYHFPDAPLRQKGEVYAGKHGQPRTREDFERFAFWQNTLLISFGSTFLLAFSFAALDAREKRRRARPPAEN